ncbi:MAG: amidohydrolase family protein [Myxococcota bacterium]
MAVGGRAGAESAARIDAAGLVVTPGFVDLHTHYDGRKRPGTRCSSLRSITG